MAKLPKVPQKVFGSTAGSSQIGVFGSLAAGSPQFTTDPNVIQSLSEYLTGWFAAVVEGNSPAIEDMNALHYLYAYQLSYIMQEGVPEWDTDTVYYTGSIVNVAGVLYSSLTNNNQGNAVTDPTNWQLAGGGTTWGSITGTLSDQTDLQTALDALLPLSGGTVSGPILISGGTLASPSIAFSGVPSTGILFYQPTTTLYFVVGGNSALQMDAGGFVTIPNALEIGGVAPILYFSNTEVYNKYESILNQFVTQLAPGGGEYAVRVGTNGIMDVDYDLSTAHDFSFGNHIRTNGGSPSIVALSAAGSGATATVSQASDSCGQLTINYGSSGLTAGAQATLTFDESYPNLPTIVLSPANMTAAGLPTPYVTTDGNGFTVNTAAMGSASGSVVYNYFVIETV